MLTRFLCQLEQARTDISLTVLCLLNAEIEREQRAQSQEINDALKSLTDGVKKLKKSRKSNGAMLVNEIKTHINTVLDRTESQHAKDIHNVSADPNDSEKNGHRDHQRYEIRLTGDTGNWSEAREQCKRLGGDLVHKALQINKVRSNYHL